MGLGFMRRIFDKANPEGPLYSPKPDGNMSKWREATAKNLDSIRDRVKDVAFIRQPEKTPVLSDLEKEFGVFTDANLTEETRRRLLKTEAYKKDTNGSDDDLQSLLTTAGFDLKVYNNSPEGPAIDPAILLLQNFQMQAMEGTNYYAGNDLAYAGNLGGEMLVNGNIFGQRSDFFGAGDLYAGNTKSVAGYFDQRVQTKTEYPIPTDPGRWPFVFFVGGDATFNLDGSIGSIDQGFVPTEQRRRLEDIILKFKPMFSWCGLIVTFT